MGRKFSQEFLDRMATSVAWSEACCEGDCAIELRDACGLARAGRAGVDVGPGWE